MEEMLRKTKVLLKSYQMAKFAVMVRTQEVEDELFDSDMKSCLLYTSDAADEL